MYVKFFGVKEEEITFTNNKITATKKAWILNDDKHTLETVSIEYPEKNAEIHFDGLKKKNKKSSEKYKHYFAIPDGEMDKANEVEMFFKSRN